MATDNESSPDGSRCGDAIPMKLFPYDTYTSLTRVFDIEERLTVVDVGANEGQTIARVLKEFPQSHVHAFEPAPETHERLAASVANDSRVSIYPFACGSKAGSADFHITGNHWCSSLLAPSELGRRYYGDWYATRQVVKVPVVTLDNWANQQGINRVDLVKVDVQGFDLEVLKGATGLLGNVRAINCECQFAPEYEGCASFSQIDRFLAENNFSLHQLHEVNDRGDEEQTTYGDGLWLRNDVLAQLRTRKNLPDLSPKGRLRRALQRAAARGCTAVALYGSGKHTQALAQFFDEMPLPIVAILDDNLQLRGERIAGREIILPQTAQSRGIDVVVLSSDAHEVSLWHKSEALRMQGMHVIALYTPHLIQQSIQPTLSA